MTVEEALEIVEQAVQPRQLNKIQRLVFEYSWQGCSYLEIAKATDYDVGYIKDTGSKLWQLLSETFGEKVTKQNLQAILKQHLRQSKACSAPQAVTFNPTQDWGEAIDTAIFYGRSQELTTLREWITQQRCRLIIILGMGGMGKTTLSVKLGEFVQPEFDFLIWRSLRDAPPIDDLLTTLIKFLTQQQNTNLPESIHGKLSYLVELLRQHRCLVILDNFDSVLQEGERAGTYRKGYQDYGELLKRIGEVAHQSCVVLTSRDKPQEIAALEGEQLPIRTLPLAGLDLAAGQNILHIKGLTTTSDAAIQLIDHYRGNPLALKIAATSIQDLFAGNISQFLEQGAIAFNGIGLLLGHQIARLSDLEKQVMNWLAIAREPVLVSELQEAMYSVLPRPRLMEVLESLKWRSLIESSPAGFTQQPVVMEYTTDYLIEQICEEIVAARPQRLLQHALMQAQAKDYIRASQIRLILQPLINQLLAAFGSAKQVEHKLKQLLAQLSAQGLDRVGYGAGNLLNLFCQLETDLTGYDWSGLKIRQAYLPDVSLRRVNFSQAEFIDCVFAATFGGITTVTFSPNGALLATCDTNGDVQVWEIASGQQLQVLKADAVWTWSVAFSPDGQWLASAGDDYVVKIWNLQTGECIQELHGHTYTINAIAFHPSGQMLASCSQDATIRLWNLSRRESNPSVQVLKAHQGRVWSVAFSPNGETLVSGSEDQSLKLWDVSTGEVRQTLTGHTHWIKAVAFSPNGQAIASGDFDGTIKLWAATTGQSLQTWKGHQATATTLAFSPNSQLLASASYDQTVKVWAIASGQCSQTLTAHNNRVWSVAFSPDGQYLASGGDDHATRLWDLQAGQCAKTWKGHTNSILSLALSANQQCLASGHEDQTVKLWHLQTGEVTKTLRGHTNRVWSVAFAPQSDPNTPELILASGSADQTIKLWQAETGRCLKTLRGHKSWVWSVALSSRGDQLASGSYDQTVKLWNVDRGECLQTLVGHTAPVVAVKFSPDGQQLASSSFDTTIRLWDVKTGNCLQTLSGHRNSVWAIAFSPDGTQLASSSYDHTVKLWDIHTGDCLHTWESHQGPVVSLAFSTDGQQLASGSFDQTVKLWDISTKKCLHTLSGHVGLVSALVFSPAQPETTPNWPAGFFSGSFDETIRFWNHQTGECLQILRTPRPYDGMNITEARGLTEAQKATLKALGAIEN